MFFVLSGFVLAVNYFDDFRQPNPRATVNYFVARFARVYPLYLLLLFYFVVRIHLSGGDIGGWWQHALALQAWDPNIAVAFGFNPPAWSISVEFFLYACFPLLVPLVARLQRPRTILVAAAAVASGMLLLALLFVLAGWSALPFIDSGSAHRWLYRMPLTRLGDFTLGILAACLYVRVKADRSLARLGSRLAIGAMVVTIGLMCWPALLYSAWSWDVAYALPASVFIFGLAVAPTSLIARGLSLPFMILLGEASYAFYLVHNPAISALDAGQWATATSFTAVTYEALALGAVIALAIGLHISFERPARTHIRRVLRWKGKPTSAPKSAVRSTAA